VRKSVVKKHFKSLENIANTLGISRAAVSQWPETVPEGAAYKLQVITGGLLRVDPNDYPPKSKTRKRAALA